MKSWLHFKADRILYKLYSNGNVAGVYRPGDEPIDDVGYVCVNGSFRKAYNAGLTGKKATNPVFARQCDTGEATWPPTSQSDLIGWPISDFSGTLAPCDSTVVNDLNWRAKRHFDFGNTGNIIGGKFRLTHTSPTQSGLLDVVSLVTGSMEMKVNVITANTFSHNSGMGLVVGGITYGIYHIVNPGPVYQLYVTKEFVGQVYLASTATPTFDAQITWDGNNVRCYIDGIERFVDPNTGASSVLYPTDINHFGTPGRSTTVEYGPYEVKNAPTGGNRVYSNIEGISC